MNCKTGISIFFIAFFICANTCYAGDKNTGKYPTAVLVQLRSEHNRILALTEARKYAMVNEVTQDALEVVKHFKLDFHDNFNYCPVYYYIDTNADLVKDKRFDDILFNEDGSPVKNPVINSNSTDYVVVYYGQALSQAKNMLVETDTSKYTYDPEPPAGKGLVVLNDKFQQLNYFYILGFDKMSIKHSKSYKYAYKSKHFEIEYYPFAALFNKTMLDKHGHRHYQSPGKE